MVSRHGGGGGLHGRFPESTVVGAKFAQLDAESPRCGAHLETCSMMVAG